MELTTKQTLTRLRGYYKNSNGKSVIEHVTKVLKEYETNPPNNRWKIKPTLSQNVKSSLL